MKPNNRIKLFIDSLKLPDYANIDWNKSCMCERCNFTREEQNAEMIGWVETDYGLMAVFECQKCFEKYRNHITIASCWDKEEFYNSFYDIMFYGKDRDKWKKKLIEFENQNINNKIK